MYLSKKLYYSYYNIIFITFQLIFQNMNFKLKSFIFINKYIYDIRLLNYIYIIFFKLYIKTINIFNKYNSKNIYGFPILFFINT